MTQDQEGQAATLTDRQATVLRAVARLEYPSIREIAEDLRISRSTAQTAVMGLVRKGLVEQLGVSPTGGVTFGLTEEAR